MAKKFNLTELLNQRSVEQQETAGGQQETARPQERKEELMMIDVYDLIPSKDNFYRVDDSLKSSIELMGVLQPLLVSEPENGKYRVIAGHRRRLAVLALVEEGKEERRFMPCVFKKEPVTDRLAIIMANRFREKTDWEKMMEAVEAEELAKELKKEYQLEGRTREVLAEITGVSEGQLGRYKAIYKNLEKGLMIAFKDNKIGFSVAAELCGLEEETQKQAEELLETNGVLSMVDVKELKKQQEEAAQIPGQMSVEDVRQEEEEQEETQEGQQEEETAKDGEDFMNEPEEYEEPKPVTSCNAYVSRTEAQKTDEQRYNEQQARLDRETAEKLREREQEGKMKQIPSEEEKEGHKISLSGTRYEEITSGKLSFLLLKKDGYKVGEEIELPEIAEGKETGRKIDIEITYVWEDWTGLDDDYCIIGFNVAAFDA